MSSKKILARRCRFCDQAKVFTAEGQESDDDFCIGCGKRQKNRIEAHADSLKPSSKEAEGASLKESGKGASGSVVPLMVAVPIVVVLGYLYLSSFAAAAAAVGGMVGAVLLLAKLEDSKSKLWLPAFLGVGFLIMGFGYLIFKFLTVLG